MINLKTRNKKKREIHHSFIYKWVGVEGGAGNGRCRGMCNSCRGGDKVVYDDDDEDDASGGVVGWGIAGGGRGGWRYLGGV